MTKYLFLSFVAFALFAISCSEGENDTGLPTIENVRLNENDSIVFGGKTFYINSNKNNDPNRVDTLVIGKRVVLKARFKNDKELSGYAVWLFPDSIKNPNSASIDTGLVVYKSGKNIFGAKDTLVNHVLFEIPVDSFTITRQRKQLRAAVREGDYLFQITVIGEYRLDKTPTKQTVPVKVLTRQSIYNARTKQ